MVHVEPPCAAAAPGITVQGFIQGDPRSMELAEADVIVAGGRGVGSREGFELLVDLASLLGGTVAAFTAGRIKKQITGGTRISVPSRLGFALTGGVLMGMAARLARGCTSGQALTGGAALSLGAWVFMFSVFAGGYALAYFMRRQWT